MTVDYLYMHLDTTSNSVFSKGFNITDFYSSIPEKPQNILLLDPNAIEGEYEPHTGLKVIRGQGQVNNYLIAQVNAQRTKRDAQLKWIDFKDIHFLQQLTAMEIAELLYFSHVASQLHSPFFYKLQNNFVYFEKPDKLTKVYYRRLDDFYQLVAAKLEQGVYEKVNERKSFFKAATPVASMASSFVKELRSVFQEGVVLDFRRQEIKAERLEIPIFVVEDQVKNIENKVFKKEDQIGVICYDLKTQTWTVVQEEWALPANLRQV